MPDRFAVRVLEVSERREIEGARTPADDAAVLEAAEFGDTTGMSDGELREVAVMALQDLEPEEAARLLLRLALGDRLAKGQIFNLSHEMAEEKAWEHYADMSLHERLFNVGSMLYAAFPGVFPEPDAVRVSLEVTAQDDDAREILAAPLHESFVVRLLADGMSDASGLHRMFDTQLAGTSFPEADTIVWIVRTEAAAPDTVRLDVTSSGYWLDGLRDTRSYTSSAWPDEATEP